MGVAFHRWLRWGYLRYARGSVRLRALGSRPGPRESDAATFCRRGGVAPANPDVLAEACRALAVVPVGEPRYSLWNRSIGTRVRAVDGAAHWLKVNGVVGPPGPWLREGEESAGALTGIPLPRVHAIHDWTSGSVAWRAVLMTLAASEVIGAALSFGLGLRPVTDDWLARLKTTLDVLERAPSHRDRLPREQIVDRITSRFGRRAPHAADEWRTAHGDLNWSNVTSPDLILLDWEQWGRAPRGYDAAVLVVRSCADEPLLARLRAVFAEDLATPSGRVAQLLVCADMLTMIEAGWVNPRYYRPIERLARDVLRSAWGAR